MELTELEQATVFRVYAAVTLSIIVPLLLIWRKRLDGWAVRTGLIGFLMCAIGWEIWFTFGLVDGLAVDARRSAALNAAIPQNINWLMNSLGDMGICFMGLLFAWLATRRDQAKAFGRWHWGAFIAMTTWFIAQNVYVEAVVYQAQLAEGFDLSWAPLAPTGPYFNPAMKLGDATLTLHGQIPWLIMPPLYYWVVIKCYRKWHRV
ncbi:MAG: hypothetical protein ACPG06_00525 [Alphaproteobacteria bacterium]